MALFGRKKKDVPTPSPFGDDDFSDFDVIGSVDTSADEYPELTYQDMDNFGIGSAIQAGKIPEEESSSEGMNVKRMMIAATVIIVGFIAIFSFINMSESGEDNAPQTSQSQESNPNNKDGKDSGLVVTEQVGKEYISNEDGNPVNGTGAILAFDYAYYTKRDGAAARELFNPEAESYNASYIQREIDKVPQGTTYKLSITPQRIGESYNVKLQLNIPGSDPVTYSQVFTTGKKDDGNFYVKQFTSSTQSDEN